MFLSRYCCIETFSKVPLSPTVYDPVELISVENAVRSYSFSEEADPIQVDDQQPEEARSLVIFLDHELKEDKMTPTLEAKSDKKGVWILN